MGPRADKPVGSDAAETPWRTMRASVVRGVVALAVLLCACSAGGGPADPATPRDFPLEAGGKKDVFGRSLAGVAAPYEHDPSLREQEEQLAQEMGLRRRTAWEIVGRALDPVPLLGLADRADEHEEVELPDGEVPQVPRWQTWYGVDDFKRIFQHLYEELGEQGRARRGPFDEEAVEHAFAWNAEATDRSSRWPLERYLRYVDRISECPEGLDEEDCARRRQSKFSGAARGNARITYSPSTVRHLLDNYGPILHCLEALDGLSMNAEASSEDNFTFCFEQEFPPDAVLVKAQWVRADFDMKLPAYDTDAETLRRVTGPETSNNWADGDREVDPDGRDVLTIELRNGNVFRLAGLHIMTKETRHWMWVTLWWSDRPDRDFGADRPDWVGERLGEVWTNYKMCVAVDYEEGDPDPARWFDDAPSLAAALDATDDGTGASWCSNPYIEEGRGNARTNCIGCHQHGGSSVGQDLDGDGTLDPFDLDAVIADEGRFPLNGRAQLREVFPGDYLWSLNRVDDLAQVIRSEVEYFDHADRDTPAGRARHLTDLDGDVEAGDEVFAEHCTRCHGEDGDGDGIGPSLYERVPMRDDLQLATTLIEGRGQMPAWGEELDDATLADLLAFLRAHFGEPDEPRDG